MADRFPTAAAFLILLAVVLSGCAKAPATSDVVQGTGHSDGARVTGKVVDEQLAPVVNGTVAVQDSKNLSVVGRTTTGEDGRFDLGKVPAGTWVISVQAAGFHAFSREFAVSSGIDQDLTLTLSAIPVAEAYHETQIASIQIDYGVAWSIGGDFNRGCIQPSVTCQAYANPSANEYFWAEDPKNAKLQTIILEEVWTPNSPVCARAMAVDVYNPDAPSTTAPNTENPHYWTNYPSEKWSTSSPIIMVIPRNEPGNTDAINDPGRIERNGNDELMARGNWTVRHFPPGVGLTNLPADVNCFTDQRFDIFWTAFYLDPAPADFTARSA